MKKKGIGLIERIKQGQGKPTKLYVKRFTTRTVPPEPAPPPPEPFASISEAGDFQKSKNPTLIILRETRRSLFRLIHPSPPAAGLEMERYERREELKANIDYKRLRKEHPCDDIDNLLELMLDVVCSTAPTIQISGSDIPAETVKERFLQLDSEHIQYVIDALKQTRAAVQEVGRRTKQGVSQAVTKTKQERRKIKERQD